MKVIKKDKARPKKEINELNVQFTNPRGKKDILGFKDILKDDDNVDERFTARKRKMAMTINDMITSKEKDPFEIILYIINFLNPRAVRELDEFLMAEPEIDADVDDEDFSTQDDMEDENVFMNQLNT